MFNIAQHSVTHTCLLQGVGLISSADVRTYEEEQQGTGSQEPSRGAIPSSSEETSTSGSSHSSSSGISTDDYVASRKNAALSSIDQL